MHSSTGPYAACPDTRSRSLNKRERTQKRARLQSVDCVFMLTLDAGESAAFSSLFLASAFFRSDGESTPTPAPVTHTVGRLFSTANHYKEGDLCQGLKDMM